MECPACKAAVADGAEFCPQCLGVIAARPAAAPAPPAVAAPEPIAPARPVLPAADEFGVDPNAPKCPHHPDKPVAGACFRCGGFYCIDCVPTAAQTAKALCPACEKAKPAREAPEQLKDIVRELWVSLVVLGLLVVAVVAVSQSLTLDRLQVAPAQRTMMQGAFVMLGVLAGLPYFLTATLLAVTGRPVFAWIAFGLEALFFALLLLFSLGVNLLSFVALAVPVYSLIRTLKMQELRRTVRALPKP